ncbi:MAG TPA: hypothetical protein VLU25_11025 [Acidobacteriota bacterium]|nr:hypothetical protein [Acidobacteriota bacterium]
MVNWKERLKKHRWLGLGGLVVGGAVALWANRSRKKSQEAPTPIPDDVGEVEIITEERRISHRGKDYRSRAVYHCTPTRFRVWSFLASGSGGPGGEESGSGKPRGLPIYYVSPRVFVRPQEGKDEPPSQVLSEEKFYATIHVYVEDRREPLAGCIARGRVVEFHKCHVGGSLNGVETGDRIISMAPVHEFQFRSQPSAGQM